MGDFDKIIGYESVKKELYQIIDMFKNRELYEKMGAKLPKGIILYGRPGMGKTMLAKALIKECGVESFLLRKNKDSSKTLDEITKTFADAAAKEPSIILIDDIDKFCDVNEYDVDDESFVAIQSGIDCVSDKNVLVVATANSYGRLPSSLRRCGRFDRKIELKNPTSSDARKIIEYYLKDKHVDKNVNFDDVAKMISYVSCSELETIINESAIYAANKRKDSIGIEDITRAYLRSIYRTPNDSYDLDSGSLATSIHEAGHAVVAEIIKPGSVGFISSNIGGRDDIGGFTHFCEEFKRRPENVLIALGGKAAVELFYEGRCASGCQSDLSRASHLIKEGVSESGTAGIGMLDISNAFGCSSQLTDANTEIVVRSELEHYLFIAKNILIKNKDFVLKLAKSLEENKYLHNSKIQEIKSQCDIVNVAY